jgi:hypothetical protein
MSGKVPRYYNLNDDQKFYVRRTDSGYDQTVYETQSEMSNTIERGSTFSTRIFNDQELEDGLIYFHRIYLQMLKQLSSNGSLYI